MGPRRGDGAEMALITLKGYVLNPTTVAEATEETKTEETATADAE